MEGSECTPKFPHSSAIVQGRTLRSVYERTQLLEYCIRYLPKTSIIVTTGTGTWVQTTNYKPELASLFESTPGVHVYPGG